MPDETQIVDLLGIPETDRGLDWLKSALQAAVELEFSTIPPYLCAWWSIKPASGRANDHLREVIMEEMLHLGLACNMLTTIGGTPRLFPDAAPRYPCPLPGGVRAGLIVPLRGLTQEGVKNIFMEIERPQNGIGGVDAPNASGVTIGDFYDAIDNAFGAISDGALTGERQLEWDIPVTGTAVAPLFKIQTKVDAARAILVIKEQGEGTGLSPFDPSKSISGDLAHYFRFAELFHGKQLQLASGGEVTYSGEDIPFPECYPMAEVPLGGYLSADVEPGVQQKLLKFDQNYAKMLRHLHTAWGASDAVEASAAFDESMSAMYTLRGSARQLMQIAIPGGTGTYGPCFRISE